MVQYSSFRGGIEVCKSFIPTVNGPIRFSNDWRTLSVLVDSDSPSPRGSECVVINLYRV
jgi:hypothetical protein